jgi:endonuclease G, mitochondrial
MMHAQRRLALITASNVTADSKLKRPDPTKTYTRKALTGLGDNDQERWFVDPSGRQIPASRRLLHAGPEGFRQGAHHPARRRDVGRHYEQLRRTNGDTYHVTNCSPQTAEYNRSASGVENWGDLENHVLAGAPKERLTLFAGPMLDPSDTVFVGAGGGGKKIRAKIPSCFWKVIVANVQDALAAFGFVLEQDLSGVDFEFVVADEFVPHMFPLSDIEEMAGAKFPGVVPGCGSIRHGARGGSVHSCRHASQAAACRGHRERRRSCGGLGVHAPEPLTRTSNEVLQPCLS